MSHYALIDENNIVYNVFYFGESSADEEEIVSMFEEQGATAIRTSYNTQGNEYVGIDESGEKEPFRKNFAGIGYTYDYDLDGFIPPQPYNSWTLNEETCLWEPPIPIPKNYQENNYYWNEEEQNWEER